MSDERAETLPLAVSLDLATPEEVLFSLTVEVAASRALLARCEQYCTQLLAYRMEPRLNQEKWDLLNALRRYLGMAPVQTPATFAEELGKERL